MWGLAPGRGGASDGGGDGSAVETVSRRARRAGFRGRARRTVPVRTTRARGPGRPGFVRGGAVQRPRATGGGRAVRAVLEGPHLPAPLRLRLRGPCVRRPMSSGSTAPPVPARTPPAGVRHRNLRSAPRGPCCPVRPAPRIAGFRQSSLGSACRCADMNASGPCEEAEGTTCRIERFRNSIWRGTPGYWPRSRPRADASPVTNSPPAAPSGNRRRRPVTVCAPSSSPISPPRAAPGPAARRRRRAGRRAAGGGRLRRRVRAGPADGGPSGGGGTAGVHRRPALRPQRPRPALREGRTVRAAPVPGARRRRRPGPGHLRGGRPGAPSGGARADRPVRRPERPAHHQGRAAAVHRSRPPAGRAHPLRQAGARRDRRRPGRRRTPQSAPAGWSSRTRRR